jgi:hypothetical protein
MTLEEPATTIPMGEPAFGRALLAILVIPTIVFGLYWGPLAEITTRAFKF